MKLNLSRLLANALRETADKLDSGNTYLSEAEQCEIFDMLTHTALCAEEVCNYLNISRATLTNYIRDGVVPKGRKLRGRKELIWFKDELVNVINR